MMMISSSLSIPFFLALTTSAEDVSVCLKDSPTSCDPRRSCEGVHFNGRECLDASVPWRLPHSRVQCCFRCCLFFWQRALGLDAVLADWNEVRAKRNIPNEAGVKKHGWPLWDDVVFSHMTPFAWAATRRMSPAFTTDTDLAKQPFERSLEVAPSMRGRPGGFGMYEGCVLTYFI